MKRIMILAGLLAAAPLPAQFVDPRKKIREIVEEVAKEMQEIDRMLLQTGSGPRMRKASERMARSVERVEKLLEQTRGSQGKVVRRIDDLLEEIQKMAQQGGGSCPFGSDARSSGQRQQDQPKPGRRQRSQQPEMKREGQRRGQDQPRGRRDERSPGKNRQARRKLEDPTQRVPPRRDAERWGDLPKYLEFLKTRGGSPEIPQRYRKFYEAFLERSRKQRGDARKRK